MGCGIFPFDELCMPTSRKSEYGVPMPCARSHEIRPVSAVRPYVQHQWQWAAGRRAPLPRTACRRGPKTSISPLQSRPYLVVLIPSAAAKASEGARTIEQPRLVMVHGRAWSPAAVRPVAWTARRGAAVL